MICVYCGEEIQPGTHYYDTNDGPVELDCFADYIEEKAEQYGFEKKKHTVSDDPWAGRGI
jgi:hypothetical protein